MWLSANDHHDHQRLRRTTGTVAYALSGAVALISTCSVGVWAWGATTLLPPAAAFCLAFNALTLSLVLAVQRSHSGWLRRFLRISLAGSAGLSSLCVATLAFGLGWLAPYQAITLALLGFALICAGHSRSQLHSFGQLAALFSILRTLPVLLRWAYDSQFDLPVVPMQPSLNPALAGAILLLGLGILLSRPESRLMRALLGPTEAAKLARRALPIAAVIPFIANWLSAWGTSAGFYGPDLSFGITSTASVTLTIALIWWSSDRQAQLEKQKREALTKLYESETRLNRVIDSIEDYAVVMLDPNGKISSWNIGAQRMQGYLAPEVVGQHIGIFFPTADHSASRALREALLTGRSANEGWLVRKDGSRLWASQVITLVKNESSRITGFLMIIHDITALKRSKEELESRVQERTAELVRTNGVLETLVNNAPVVIFATDREGKITLMRGRSLQSIGLSSEQTVGKSSAELFPDHDQLLRTSERARRGQAISDIICYKDVYFDVRSSPLFDDEGQFAGSIGVATDVTDRERAHQLLEEQRKAMVNSAKMSAVGEMAAGIAHEVNTPLGIIAMSAGQAREFLEDGAPQLPAAIKSLVLIEKTVFRISKIIQGLRRISKDGTHDPAVPTSLRAIIEDTFVLCRERFKNGGVRLIEPDLAEDITLSCRPIEVGQALLNLMNNAYDAIEALPEKSVEVAVHADGEMVHITVTDSGSGIPPEIQKKIMQPFFTTKALGKGTGLGLSISVGIIQRHGGKLWIDHGCRNTRFVISLPMGVSGSEAVAA